MKKSKIFEIYSEEGSKVKPSDIELAIRQSKNEWETAKLATEKKVFETETNLKNLLRENPHKPAAIIAARVDFKNYSDGLKEIETCIAEYFG